LQYRLRPRDEVVYVSKSSFDGRDFGRGSHVTCLPETGLFEAGKF
jgi:hypothetical protein